MGPGDPLSSSTAFIIHQKPPTSSTTMASSDHGLKSFKGLLVKLLIIMELGRLRVQISLQGKGYWSQLKMESCSTEVKEEATALLVNALGYSAFRVCISSVDNPLGILDLLDARYASKRAASRINVLTTLYTKLHNGTEHKESLCNQLELIGEDTAVPETQKAPLLLASMGKIQIWNLLLLR